MKKLLLGLAALIFCCFNFVNAQDCQGCADEGGFFCGYDEANWTQYSPNGCVPSQYINDGWNDCYDGSDEAADTSFNCETEDGCTEDGFWYNIGYELFIEACTYVVCENNGTWSDVMILENCDAGCEDCAEANGFYCGDDPTNWTQYSPNGCVSSQFINDGWNDCYDGSDEAADTSFDCETELEGCYDDMGQFYEIGEEWWGSECEYIICEEGGSWSSVIDDCETEEGCTEGDEFYPIGFEWVMSDCSYYECIGIEQWEFVDNCNEACDTVYIEVIVTDTVTVIEYQDVIITEYIDCDSGLPCTAGMGEIIEKSKADGKIYNLLGQEIFRRDGIYIEGGEIKYRF